MPIISVGKLNFAFPDGWEVLLYDETPFYLDHFRKLADSKCVDVVALSPNSEHAWLIEVTDYRLYDGEKPKGQNRLDIIKEVSEKMRDTLANLHLAERKTEIGFYAFARQASSKTKFRVVLHLEQSLNPTRQVIKNWHDAHIKLRQSVRVIDPHPWLCHMGKMPPSCPWQVSPKS